jgi:hypothetical protein
LLLLARLKEISNYATNTNASGISSTYPARRCHQITAPGTASQNQRCFHPFLINFNSLEKKTTKNFLKLAETKLVEKKEAAC